MIYFDNNFFIKWREWWRSRLFLYTFTFRERPLFSVLLIKPCDIWMIQRYRRPTKDKTRTICPTNATTRTISQQKTTLFKNLILLSTTWFRGESWCFGKVVHATTNMCKIFETICNVLILCFWFSSFLYTILLERWFESWLLLENVPSVNKFMRPATDKIIL
jgi:hypothetical protein